MKILVAIDGSTHARQALERALGWVAQGLQAEFVLVNVQEPASLYEVVFVHDAEAIERVRSSAGADLLQPAEAALDAAGLSYESEVAGGVPEHLIVELAENYGCDLIVLGAYGVGTREGGGIGPVAQAVLNASPVPVMIVRAAPPGEPVPASDADDAA